MKEISINEAFDPKNRSKVNDVIRQASKNALDNETAKSLGILRPGGKRYKKAKIAPSVLVRNEVLEITENRPRRYMHVGSHQLIWEIKPNSKAAHNLQCRIIAGEEITPLVFQVSQNVFKATLEQTGFEEIGLSTESMLSRFVNVLNFQSN